ncbi:Fur family transcriptional regulator [Victivallis vadensis]|uniref:Fur family transcriptional regulator n=1 Tax=Victivallis vadensis TaxID=172901 RepID=UPI00266BF62D|nr:Fur family transcriptional regulator [Victivallis vadensis]
MQTATHTEFLKLCRKIGWKCTSQRLAVYEFLQGNHAHPDVDTVWFAVRSALPTITRESVYRILNEFTEMGIIGRLDHIDNARYDSRVGAHGHFICGQCGEISDFDWPEGAVIPPEMLSRGISHMEIRLVGVCKRCAAATGGAVPAGAAASQVNDFPNIQPK